MPKRNKRKKNKVCAKEMFALDFAKTNSILSQKPILHVCFGDDIEVENCNKILQYTDTNICLDMKNALADIKGDNLIIKSMLKEKIIISGRVFSIVFRFENGGTNHE